jgi:hypothetical protein
VFVELRVPQGAPNGMGLLVSESGR